jgi:surface protein
VIDISSRAHTQRKDLAFGECHNFNFFGRFVESFLVKILRIFSRRPFARSNSPAGQIRILKEKMDAVTMVLVERETGIPLDLVILINNFLYEKLTDRNFFQAVALWFDEEKKCKLRFGHISYWKTSRVTTMQRAFERRHTFNEDISRWDVSNVTNMCAMFYRAIQFNGDLSRWNVGKVIDMSCMFSDTDQFNGDLSHWDVRNVIYMSWMFAEATNFNGDLSRWEVNNVTHMSSMFAGAIKFNSDLSRWDISNVIDMSGIFHEAMKYDGDLQDRWKVIHRRRRANK